MLEDYVPTDRDDFWFKLPLAKLYSSHVKGLPNKNSLSSYLYNEHVYFWNDFVEHDGSGKIGKRAFHSSFRQTATSISQEGFDFSKLPSGQGIGSHRLACLLSRMDLNSQEVKSFTSVLWPSSPHNFRFFLDRGVSGLAVAEAMLEKIRFFENQHLSVMVVWPRAQAYLSKVASILQSNFGPDVIILTAIASRKAIQNLIFGAYESEPWLNSKKARSNKISDVLGDSSSGEISMIVLPRLEPSEVGKLKSEIRAIWNFEFQGIHTTDSKIESTRLWGMMRNPWAWSLAHEIDPFRLRRLRNSIIEANLGYERKNFVHDVCVSGSVWLELFGIRKSADLDIIFGQNAEVPMLGNGVDVHNEYLQDFGVNTNEVFDDLSQHVDLGDMRMLSPSKYLSIMQERREDKDMGALPVFAKRTIRVYELAQRISADQDLQSLTTIDQKTCEKSSQEIFYSDFLSASGMRSIRDADSLEMTILTARNLKVWKGRVRVVLRRLRTFALNRAAYAAGWIFGRK